MPHHLMQSAKGEETPQQAQMLNVHDCAGSPCRLMHLDNSMQNFVCNEGQQLLLQISAKGILQSRNTVIFLSGGSALQSK